MGGAKSSKSGRFLSPKEVGRWGLGDSRRVLGVSGRI